MSQTLHVILGSGALATEIEETLRLVDSNVVVRQIDVDEESDLDLSDRDSLYYLGVGNPQIRSQISARFSSLREFFPSLIHPNSLISESALISNGTYISAQTVVSSKSEIHFGTFVNYGVMIGHDVLIDEYSVLAPNATISGWCRLGARVMLGANSTLLPRIKVADDAVIGAGAVVVKDVAQQSRVAGNPAVELGPK